MSIYSERESYNSDFTTLDNQLGYSVTVNGTNLYTYCYADLIDYELVPAKINYDVFKNIGKHSYIVNQYKNSDNGIKFNFYVGGASYQLAQLNVNKLINLFQQNSPVVVKVSDTQYEYVCVLTNVSVSYTDVYHYYKVTLTTVAVKRLPAVTVYQSGSSTLASGITITNEGTVESGLIIFFNRVTGSTSPGTVSFGTAGNLKTITINNLTATMYHAIDGLRGRVLRGTSNSSAMPDFDGYVNNFANVDLYEFPTVVPGDNIVKLQAASGNLNWVRCMYYPTFTI